MSQAFPVDCLPPILGEFVQRSAEATCCDPAMVALPVLSTAAAAIGNTRCVRLKTGWEEPCILWTGIVAPPGSAKSPALRAATKPLLEEQQYACQDQEWQSPSYSEKSYSLIDSVREAIDLQQAPSPPTRQDTRYVTTDATPAAIIQLLADNPRGLLYYSDELAGWLKDLVRRGGEQDWLSVSGIRKVQRVAPRNCSAGRFRGS